MLVTVFSDASYCPDTSAGGWGAWCKSERGTICDGGILKMTANSSGMAELMAAVNAVKISLNKKIALPGDHILLQSDCQQVGTSLIQYSRDNLYDQGLLIRDIFDEICQRYDIKVVYRHVKGHTRGHKPRLWVNNFCDDLARQSMEADRAQRRRKYA